MSVDKIIANKRMVNEMTGNKITVRWNGCTLKKCKQNN